MTEETEIMQEQEDELGKKFSMVNPYELFDKLERYPAEIFKRVFLLLKKYDQHIAETGMTDGFDISSEPWEVQLAFDYNKDFIENSCLKWLKKAAVARENGKKGGRPKKDVEKRTVKAKKADNKTGCFDFGAGRDVMDSSPSAQNDEKEKAQNDSNKKSSENNLKNQNDNNFENQQKPTGFFCAHSKPDRLKNAKNNPAGHNVYMFKCLNVGCSNVDRDIGGVGEKGKGCITCGQVVQLFKSGGKRAVFSFLRCNGFSPKAADG